MEASAATTKTVDKPQPRSIASDYFFATAVAVVTFLAFSPVLHNGFVNWDDDRNFLLNPNYRGFGTQQLSWMFTTFHLGHYQPLSWLSLALDYVLWGMNPAGYHLTNLLLHCFASALFYFIARHLLSLTVSIADTALSWSAALAALLFSIHPLRVESVAWVTERRDVLSAVLLFSGLLFYISAARSTRLYRGQMTGAVVCYALSLLAKASGMTFAAVLVAVDIYPLRRLPLSPNRWFSKKHLAIGLEKVPFLLLGAACGFVALLAQKDSGALVSVEAYGVARRLGQAFYAVAFYIWKTLLPLHLSPLYQAPFLPTDWTYLFIGSAAFFVLVTAALFWKRKEVSAVFLAWISYLIMLAPVSGAAQSGFQLVADRYSYLPCLPFALLGAGACIKTPAPRRWIVIAAALLVTFLGFSTWQQTRIWRNSGTLWRHAVAITPNSSVAQFNLAVVLEGENNLEAATDAYQRAISLDPAAAEAHYNLARLLARSGKTDAAISEYRRAEALEPLDADTHNNIALLLIKRGDLEAGRSELLHALDIDPDHARAHYNLGKLLASQERFDEAVAEFNRALAKAPDVAEIHEHLARALARQGKKQEAMLHYEQAVKILKAPRR